MLTAIEDVDVVVRVHANAADFLKRPARREFRPVLHRFVCVFTIAHGSHGQDSLLLSLVELVTKQRARPATVLAKALPRRASNLRSRKRASRSTAASSRRSTIAIRISRGALTCADQRDYFIRRAAP